MKQLTNEEIETLRNILKKSEDKETITAFAEKILDLLESENQKKLLIKTHMDNIRKNILAFTQIREAHNKILEEFNIKVSNYNKLVSILNKDLPKEKPIDLSDTQMVDAMLFDYNTAQETTDDNSTATLLKNYIGSNS